MRLFAIATILCTLGTLPDQARAQDGVGQPIPLQAWLRKEAAPFAAPHYTAIITAGKEKFGFLVPEEFFVRGDPTSGTFTLATAGGSSSITFSVLPTDSSSTADLSTDAFRDRVLRDYPNGKIVQEFPATALGGSGSGFDIQWKMSATIVECKRIIFVPTKAGVLMFTTTTSSTHFASVKSVLNSMLLSFQFSTNGVLKIPPLPADS
jgi:hypothetical protein